MTVSSRCSTNFLTYGRPMRAVTFQSIARMSSPARYSRTSTNSRPVPLNVDLYSPTNDALTILRVLSWIWRSFFRNSSESFEPRARGGRRSSSGRFAGLRDAISGSGHFDRHQDLLDHVVRRLLFGLGLVGQDDAVAEH